MPTLCIGVIRLQRRPSWQRQAPSSECIAYFALMDMDGVDPAEGVWHCASLAAYGAT